MRADRPSEPAPRRSVLFLCTGNSCRSQMAEALLRHLGRSAWEAASAGHLETPIHPMVPVVLAEIGVAMHGQHTKHRDDLAHRRFDLAITLCRWARGVYPRVPNADREEFWDVEDPYGATGSPDEVRAVFRRVRDDLRARVEDLLRREG